MSSLLNPKRLEELIARFACSRIAILGDFFLDKYLDIEGPFNPAFRNADSTWSLATEAELEKGLAMLRAKIDAGEADAWLAEREALRAKVGQTTTVVAVK